MQFYQIFIIILLKVWRESIEKITENCHSNIWKQNKMNLLSRGLWAQKKCKVCQYMVWTMSKCVYRKITNRVHNWNMIAIWENKKWTNMFFSCKNKIPSVTTDKRSIWFNLFVCLFAWKCPGKIVIKVYNIQTRVELLIDGLVRKNIDR